MNKVYKDKYINNIVEGSQLINKKCEYCNKNKWDILIDDKHTCGECYNYIYNEVE